MKAGPLVVLRLYGPLDPWFDKTWRPGEIEQLPDDWLCGSLRPLLLGREDARANEWPLPGLAGPRSPRCGK